MLHSSIFLVGIIQSFFLCIFLIETFIWWIQSFLSFGNSNLHSFLLNILLSILWGKTGFSAKNKKSVKYPNLPSAMRPVPNYNNLQVPKPPEKCSLDETDKDAAMHQPGRGSDNYPDYALCMSNELHLIIQSEWNNLVRDLDLPKPKAELLGQRLQEWRLPSLGTFLSFKAAKMI